MYTKRVLEAKLKEYLSFFSVVGLMGPRQSGKSTLLQHVLPDYTYVTFDDFQLQELFYSDPKRFFSIYSNKVIFDEVQKVPEIFNEIKILVDNDRNTHGKFVLTGSSQFQFIKGVTESLAGRIGLLTLLPYQYVEVPENLHAASIYQGGYPELVNKQYTLSADWFAGYINTYLTKDVTAIANIGDLRDFQRLIKLLAAQTSQILNMSTYARDLGVDVKTIKRWLSVLEASYIIYLLPPFYQNFGKRLVKNPKIYFYDTGLVSYLCGINSQTIFENGPMAGAIFENYIVTEIVKQELHNRTHAELFYYRDSNGNEVDLIIDRQRYREWIEIKFSHTFRPGMLKTISSLIGKEDKGYLLYNGQSMPFDNNIHVMNYQHYLKEE